jgi:hypothetical protein
MQGRERQIELEHKITQILAGAIGQEPYHVDQDVFEGIMVRVKAHYDTLERQKQDGQAARAPELRYKG